MAWRQGLALLEVFLLLSAAPINAHRLQGLEGALENAEELQAELMRAQQEEASEGAGARAGSNSTSAWGSCDDRQRDFERKLKEFRKTEQRAFKEEGRVDTVEGAWLALRGRGLMKALEGAQDKECAWATEESAAKTVDVADLQSLMADVAPRVPCLSTTKEMLESAAKEEDPERQRVAVISSLSVLSTEDCKAPPVERPSSRPFEEVLQEEKASAAQEDEEALDLAVAAGEAVGQGSALLELGREKLSGPNVGAIIVALVVVVLLVMFACWLFLKFFIIMVVMLVLCTLKSLIHFFVTILQDAEQAGQFVSTAAGCAVSWISAAAVQGAIVLPVSAQLMCVAGTLLVR